MPLSEEPVFLLVIVVSLAEEINGLVVRLRHVRGSSEEGFRGTP